MAVSQVVERIVRGSWESRASVATFWEAEETTRRPCHKVIKGTGWDGREHSKLEQPGLEALG